MATSNNGTNRENALLRSAMAELVRSNADKRHPFRLFTLGTIHSSSGTPQLRTVVKRKFIKENEILFYTDLRSEKITDIQSNPSVSALFYHHRKKLQLRLKCQAELPGSRTKVYKEHKQIVSQMNSANDYRTKLYPGTPINESESIEYSSRIHFALVKLNIFEMEVLKLGRKEHQRYRYTWLGNKWKAEKLVP